MLNQTPNSACGVLYIDDEEKALKYFRMAYSPDFKVFTASSGQEGIEILRRESKQIGVIISDQRMPEMVGAEVLEIARREFPMIVRILTTAYSDLDSAIQAVNKGHIYQYVVKPWDVDDLRMVLRRAADYYHVLSERNGLLELKMTVLQRIVCSDRVKWLLLSSRDQDAGARDDFQRAMVSLISALPELLNPVLTEAETFSPRHFQIGVLIREEYENATRCLDLLEAFETETAAEVRPELKGLGEPLASRIEAFVTSAIAEFELAANEHELKVSGDTVHFEIRAIRKSMGQILMKLFGLLVERQVPEVALRLFSALLALSRSKKTLEIRITPTTDEAPSLLVFNPAEAPASASEAISALYEKFSSWDISRL